METEYQQKLEFNRRVLEFKIAELLMQFYDHTDGRIIDNIQIFHPSIGAMRYQVKVEIQ